MRQRQASYPAIRETLEPGDVVAFRGRGAVSDVICAAQGGAPSHIGIVARSAAVLGDRPHDLGRGGWILDCVESTSLDGFTGVTRTRLSQRVVNYGGEVWILPLRPDVRARLAVERLLAFLLLQAGRAYALPSAIAAGLAALVGTRPLEDPGRYFCSQLAADGLVRGGVLPRTVNPEAVRPLDLVSFDIYDEVIQVAGAQLELPDAGTVDPLAWSRAALT